MRADNRVIIALSGSIIFHIALLMGYIRMSAPAPEEKLTIINDVNLLVKQQNIQNKTPARPKPAESVKSTLDFLKMAIIQPPKPPEEKPVELKAPQIKRELKQIESLLEKQGKLESRNRMEMELNSSRAQLAEMSNLAQSQRSQLAAVPKIELEEVGTRKAAVMPNAINFDPGAQTLRPKTAAEFTKAMEQTRRALAAMPALEDKGAVKTERFIPSMPGLPGGPAALPESAASLKKRRVIEDLEKEKPAEQPVIKEAKNEKMFEIEGPLAGRRIVHAELPAFPDWARDKNIIEAVVSIRFRVDRAGNVLEAMSVEKTSGYPPLDRLVMETLRKWLFEPYVSDSEIYRQWGIITFKFVQD